MNLACNMIWTHNINEAPVLPGSYFTGTLKNKPPTMQPPESLKVLQLLPIFKGPVYPQQTLSHSPHAYRDIFLYFVSPQCEGKNCSSITFLGVVFITAQTLDSTNPTSVQDLSNSPQKPLCASFIITVHMRNNIKADFPQNTGEKKKIHHISSCSSYPWKDHLQATLVCLSRITSSVLQICTAVRRLSLMGVLLALTH